MESTGVAIRGVPAEEAGPWWPLVGRWVEDALAHGGGLLSLEDVQGYVASRDMQLWTIHAPDLCAVCVTEIRVWPRAKELTAVIVGGHGMERWIGALEALLTRYAKEMGCSVLDCHGRRGWARVLGKYGWTEATVTFAKEIR